MRKYRKINESDLDRLSKIIRETEEIDEIFTGSKLEDFFQGVKGLYQGEGFYFFKYLSKIKNRSTKVKNELVDIKKFVQELLKLKENIDKIKNIAPEKKLRLLNLIDLVSQLWKPFEIPFSKAVDEINALSSQKLKGERLDVIPGSKKSALGKDYMDDKDETSSSDDLSKPELINPTQTTTGPTTNVLATPTITEEIKRFKQLIR